MTGLFTTPQKRENGAVRTLKKQESQKMIYRFKSVIKLFLPILILNLLPANVVEVKVAECEINGDGTVSYRLDVRNNEPFEGWQLLIDPYPHLTGPGGPPSGGLGQELGHFISLGQNGVLLGLHFDLNPVPANTEFTHLTTISYTYDENSDPCTMPMELLDAGLGTMINVWGITYQFTGQIISHAECSDGISQTAMECSQNGGDSDFIDAEIIWHGYDPILLGDVNMDGNINVMDIISIINHILGTVLLDDSQFAAADMNGNGSVDVTDIIQIVNVILSE